MTTKGCFNWISEDRKDMMREKPSIKVEKRKQIETEGDGLKGLSDDCSVTVKFKRLIMNGWGGGGFVLNWKSRRVVRIMNNLLSIIFRPRQLVSNNTIKKIMLLEQRRRTLFVKKNRIFIFLEEYKEVFK